MYREHFAATFLALTIACSPGAAHAVPAQVAPGGPTFDHDHTAWTALLKRHVRDGRVDYRGLKKKGRADLDAYLKTLEAVSRGELKGWTKNQALAFWINVYNAYTVRLILDNHPLKSIREIGLLPHAAFRKSFIPFDASAGRTLSLNDVENDILRKRFSEPRIHFAIVCASESCPALPGEAYRASRVNKQLASATRGFLRDKSKNRFDAGSRTLHLSKIFDWFEKDFVRGGGSVQKFVARYLPEVETALEAGELEIEHLDYDWSLNGK